MKIHYKALLIFAAAICVLFTVVFFLSTRITLGAYREIEASQMQQLALRFSLAMEDRSERVSATMGDWSPWTDLYEYLETRDPRFVRENITPETLRNLNLDFLFILDLEGELVSGAQMDSSREKFIPVDPTLVSQLRQAGYFPLNEVEARATGKLLLSNQVYTVASFPVLTNLREGPAKGYVVGGAIFTPMDIYRMERGASFALKFLPITGEGAGEDWDAIRTGLLGQSEPVLSIIDDEAIAIYIIFRDLSGEPSFVAKLTSPRTMFQAGEQISAVFLVAFAIIGGVLFLTVFFGLDFAVLSPIRKLQQRVEVAETFSEIPLDLKMPGRDEVSLLATKIEQLAASLSHTQKRYRAVVESQQDLICRYQPDGLLTFSNSAFSAFFGFSVSNKEPAHHIQDLLEAENDEAPGRLPVLSAEVRQREAEVAIHRPDGQTVWFQRSSLGIFDERESLVEIQDILRNITESRLGKRRLEESEFRYRTLFENDWDGIIISDGATRKILDVNPSLCLLLGKQPQHFIGLDFSEIPQLEILNQKQPVIRASGDRRDVRHTTVNLIHDDGTNVYVDVVVSPYSSEGRLMVQWNLRDVTDRRRSDDQLRSLSSRLLTLQDQERRRIARELHDSTGQNLTALQMSLTMLEKSLPIVNEETSRLITESRALLDLSCAEIRTLSYLLHPPLLDEMGLLFAIRWFVDGFAKRTGIRVDANLDETMERLPMDVETALYRIVQESFNNIHRHSGGTRCWVRLHRRADGVLLEIEDDGMGVTKERMAEVEDVLPSLGVGLPGMRERLTQLNGTLEVLSSSTGTIIRAIIHHPRIDE